ncbi:MAG: hypothetical protein E7191_00050 [Erysipelotrichaceae bacterium]|nr:hypothetical protein [Erysipelotrichaceae bacterium]MBQ9987586.1 hypothetical protein [Erysipelotrichales bacterium]MBR3693174.1 hypothetical protein [Erysipelotrichales bacterium]
MSVSEQYWKMYQDKVKRDQVMGDSDLFVAPEVWISFKFLEDQDIDFSRGDEAAQLKKLVEWRKKFAADENEKLMTGVLDWQLYLLGVDENGKKRFEKKK